MKFYFYIFLFAFSSHLTLWGQEPLSISLKQAEDLAIQNNYSLNASLHKLEQGYHGFLASKAYFKPKIDVNAAIDLTKDNQRSVDGAIMLTRPLFDRVAHYQMKEAQIQWEMLRLEVQQRICDLLYQVRNAYNTVLLNRTHLAVDQLIIQIWESEVKRQQRLLELGSLIPYELNQSQLHMKGAWIDFYSTQSEMKKSQIQLLTLLGIAPNTELELTEKEIPLPEIEGIKCTYDQWKVLTFQYRPQLQQEQFSFLLTQNRVSKTQAERLPTFSLYANAGQNYVNNGFDNQPRATIGVNVDWSLYDPTRRHRLKQAKEGSQEAASNYQQVELETNAVIYSLLNEIEKSYFAYLAAQEGALLAEKGIQLATKKHQLGLMSPFEYRDVIKTLHEARQNVNQAKFEVNDRYNQLVQQSGLDLKQCSL